MKKILEKYLVLIFRIGLVVITLTIWDSFSKVRTWCDISYDGFSERSLACLSTKENEEILRSFFSDSYPLILFIGIFYILFWFKEKK